MTILGDAIAPRSHRSESTTAPRWCSPGRVALALGAVYLVAGAALLPGYRYQLNPDGVSYLAIARHYADGRWSEAVNGYWGPLYSWLLAPLLAAGGDGLLVARAVNLLAGAAALAAIWALAGRYSARPWLRVVAVATMVPVVLGWAFALVTPDLLLAALLLWYLYALTAPDYSRVARYALLAGLLGGAAYLAKAYALPFFLAHFLAVSGWRIRRSGTQMSWAVGVRRMSAGLAAFGVVAGPWIAAISAKYGHLTYGTAAAYNWRLIGPDATGHPTYQPGLLAPTGPRSTSVWEDPGRFDLPTWSAVHAPGHLLRVLARNTVDAASIVAHFSPLAVVIVLVGLLAATVRGIPLTPAERGRLRMTGFTAALLTLGYLIVVVEPRYIWFALALLPLTGVLLLDVARRRRLLNTAGLAVASAVLVAGFWTPAGKALGDGYGAGSAEATAGAQIRRDAPELVGRRIASDGSYRSSLFVSYHLAAHYYGMTPADPGSAARELAANHVEYLLYWGDPAAAPAYLRGAAVVFSRPGLRVYRLPAVPAST
jgi:hypothetical protein